LLIFEKAFSEIRRFPDQSSCERQDNDVCTRQAGPMNSGPTDAAPRPSAIGGYEGWPAYLRTHPHYVAESAAAQELSDALGVPDVPANPAVVLESEVTHDGVWTATAVGEDAVHGALPTPAAPWLAWSGRFGSGEPDGGPATLVFLPVNPDPWFVRMAGYPGLGLSLAWEHAATASHANPIHRTVTVLVADGLLSTSDIEQLITTLGESK